MVKEYLEHLGFEVEPVADGSIAVERLVSEPTRYAAVLMDVTMPGLGGVEATQRIHERVPDVPVVLMSGFTSDAMPAELRHVTFLSKPFRLDALADVLDRALS